MTNISFLNDEYCKFFNVFYKRTLTADPYLKIEVTVTTVTGTVGFNYGFYSDSELTQYTSSSPTTIFSTGTTTVQVDNPQQLYALGRFGLIPGSSIRLSSLKINDVEHIVSGTLFINTPAITFLESTTISWFNVYTKLGKISYPQFNIESNLQSINGNLLFEYLYYTDNTYTTLSFTTTSHVSIGTNTYNLQHTDLFVMVRFKISYNSSFTVSSFKINGAEQLSTPLTYSSPAISGNICFPAGTLVSTDQGDIEIQKLIPMFHSIEKSRIVAITETFSSDPHLVCIEKDSIGPECPTMKTIISKKHKIMVDGEMIAAHRLVGKFTGIYSIPYKGEKLYNVVLKKYGQMKVHGMECETLHPDNPLSVLFSELYQNEKLHQMLCLPSQSNKCG